MKFNAIDIYAETGRKAGVAQNHGDAALVSFHKDWLTRALALEEADYRKAARAAYERAYTEARTIRLTRPR